MDRKQILHWLEDHRHQMLGDPNQLLDRCESEVRRHATEDAWMAAHDYVERRMHDWEGRWGFHASEAHVAREICRSLSAELRRHEPHPHPGDESHLAGEGLLRSLQPEARSCLAEWILERASEYEHRAWGDIVRFTRSHGRRLVREGRVSKDDTWEGTQNYQEKATRVAGMLAEELEARARESARTPLA